MEEKIQKVLNAITKGIDPCCNQPICTDLDSIPIKNLDSTPIKIEAKKKSVKDKTNF